MYARDVITEISHMCFPDEIFFLFPLVFERTAGANLCVSRMETTHPKFACSSGSQTAPFLKVSTLREQPVLTYPYYVIYVRASCVDSRATRPLFSSQPFRDTPGVRVLVSKEGLKNFSRDRVFLAYFNNTTKRVFNIRKKRINKMELIF